MKKTSGQASPIQATRFPSLDMSKIIKLVENVNKEQLAERELENYLAENDLQDKAWTSEQLQTATDLVIKEILETYYYKKDIKRKIYYRDKNRTKKVISYNATSENALLTILIVGGSLLYFVKIYTVNFYEKEIQVCYYDERHMLRNDEAYLVCLLRDFSELAHECKELKFCFEKSKDRPPRSVFMDNGAVFYEVHEKKILTPMHYYAGYNQHEKIYIDQKTGIKVYAAEKYEKPKKLPFDQWLKELLEFL